jgi:hypothetical protein
LLQSSPSLLVHASQSAGGLADRRYRAGLPGMRADDNRAAARLALQGTGSRRNDFDVIGSRFDR